MGLADKLPSWKGFTAFLYVAAHWGTISGDLEQYRRQIHDREEWAAKVAAEKDALIEATEDRLRREVMEWVDKATQALKMVKETHAMAAVSTKALEDILGRMVESVGLLAMMISTESQPTRALLLASMSPELRRAVEREMSIPPAGATLPRLRGPQIEGLFRILRPPGGPTGKP